MCSICAAVQGMDETANNGAQNFFLKRLNITTARFSTQEVNNLTGLVVGAPYLACTVLGCWLTAPLNSLIGRRGTIFVSCAIAAIASIWEAVANSWVNLFIARFALGLGIGSKSTTVPVYAAECAPAPIRGALVMMWQMWTAFGIMLGNIMGVAFLNVGHDLNWRLMLGSTVVLPLIVCCQVYLCPESPRWLIKKNRISKAFEAFRKIRPSDIQAARDLYYCYVNVEIERKVSHGRNMVWELFTVNRNRRAAWASWIVMFGQQVNLPPPQHPFLPQRLTHPPPVLRRKRNSLLLHHHIHLQRVLRILRPPRQYGHRHLKLGVRPPRLPNYRHLWPAQPPTVHLPFLIHLPLLDGLLVLAASYETETCGYGYYGDVFIRSLLLPRHGSRSIHLFRRSVSFTYPRGGNVLCHSDDLVF